MKLPFYDLAARHPGVTNPIGDSYTEAALVCMDRHHLSPIDFTIKNNALIMIASAEWEKPTNREKAAWANEIDTTEAGAYACALAAIEILNGQVAIRRAETKSGADYYIAPISNSSMDDLENCFRLEVSGVDKGEESIVKHRLRMKIQQASVGASNLPAIAAVVGFNSKLILIRNVE
jgi:hypothetical protein